jgi:hypothetical protein
LGLGTTVPVSDEDRALILSGVATALAPPDTPVIEEDLGPLQVDPLLFASVLHGEAQAQFGDLLDRCPTLPLKNPFAMGEGHLAQAQLINTGDAPAEDDDPFDSPLVGSDSAVGERAAFTRSITYPIANPDGTFGLVSEVHATVAPIRISTAPGPLDDITIRVIGEAVMKVTATGKPGGATVEYTPPPTLSIQQGITPPVVIIPAIPLPIPPILSLFEEARAIGSQEDPQPPETAANGTVAAAAADVARIALPGGLVDIRLLHTEARVQVPPGGFSFNDCGQLRVTKNVVGPLAGPFSFHVVCPGVTLLPSESDFELANGGSKTISVPTGTECTVTEPGKGGATQTVIAESPPANTGTSATDGVVTIPAAMGIVTVAFTNSNLGNLQVFKTAQDGVPGPFGFTVSCVNGTTPVALAAADASFTLTANTNRLIRDIPGGSVCTVVESDDGGASVTRITDSTVPTNDGIVTIVGGATQPVTFSNAGPPLVISKVETGATAGKGPYTFHLVCTDASGAAVALDPADADFTLDGGQQKLITKDIPDGSTCVVTEVDKGGATTTTVADTSGANTADGSVTIQHLTTQTVTFTNNFVEPIKLIVSKTVVGTGSGPFTFTVTCTNNNAPVVLPPADASFTLNHGGSRSIKNIPNGAICTVTETPPAGASRTYNETSGTPNDGIVTIPVDGAATVGVTNTFVPPAQPIVEPAVVAPRTVG